MSLVETPYRAAWDTILPLLNEAISYQREGLRAEDVFSALKAGTAHLFTSEDGFVILRIELSEIGEKTLLVWFAGSSSSVNVREKYLEDLYGIAQRANCSRLTYVSTRRGFEKKPGEGWELQHTRYTRRI